jgi:hypothetical protein
MIVDAAAKIYERRYPELSDDELFKRMWGGSYEAYIELRGINLAGVLNQCWHCITQRNGVSLASLEMARQMADTCFHKFWDSRDRYTDGDDVEEIFTLLIRETYEQIFSSSDPANS